MEEQPRDVPTDDAPPAEAPYEPPVAETIEGPDPESVGPGVTPGVIE